MREFERREGMEALRRQGKTLEEIGKTYGVTRERVRQLVGHVVKDRGVGRAFDEVELVIENPWGLGTFWCEGCGEILTYNAGYGLCVACYSRRRWRNSSDEHKRKHREHVKSWQRRNPQKTRESNRRANRGRCPLCDREYAHIYSHLKSVHPADYRPLLDQVNEEKRRGRKG